MYIKHGYQAILQAPFGMLGIRCDGEALLGVSFLPENTKAQYATSVLAEVVCEQLSHYFEKPDFLFTIPYKHAGSEHQRKVWQAMLNIPCGGTRQYGELAAELQSSARAVGQACGANPLPIVIPCHRVVGRSGVGGFMQSTGNSSLAIKHWLLKHEQC
jgi:methylated-DNA-[protein]-cysteine S-methyltransferase